MILGNVTMVVTVNGLERKASNNFDRFGGIYELDKNI